MIFCFEERPTDSPWVERIWRTHSERAGSFVSIAASRWEMVVASYEGQTSMTVRGPETIATPAACPWKDAEFFGIVFQLGAFMPHLPPGRIMERRDARLPEATGNSFWLHGSAWQYPDYDNADTFVDWLVRDGLLVREPVVEAALRHLQDASLRTIQRHFLRSTGLTYRAIRQIERARYATTLLQHGASILDAVFEAGYYDQAHLTRSLTRFIGQTPTQILDKGRSVQLSLLYKTTPLLSRYGAQVDHEQRTEVDDAENQAGRVRRAGRGSGEPGLDRAVLER